MPIQAIDLDGRRCGVGAAILHIPVAVIDRDGTEVGRFRSPRKLARAIIAGAVILVDGDTTRGVLPTAIVSSPLQGSGRRP
jgi:hypothetical protein